MATTFLEEKEFLPCKLFTGFGQARPTADGALASVVRLHFAHWLRKDQWHQS